MLTQLTGTNTEIDIYGCLVRKLEAKVGCQLERSVQNYQSNRTWAKPNACLEFDKVVQETMRKDKWLKSSLASISETSATSFIDDDPGYDYVSYPTCRNVEEVLNGFCHDAGDLLASLRSQGQEEELR